MTLRKYAFKAGKLLTDNSPTILTAVGVTGTLTTAYLTGKATLRASTILENQVDELYKANKGRYPLTNKETFLLVWKEYIPAAGVAFFTIGCIIGANRIGTRRTAAVVAAYSVLEKGLVEYSDKVVEKWGESKERDLRDEINLDHLRKNPPPDVFIQEGLVWFCEKTTNTYFQSTMERVKRAEVDTNFQILHNDYCTLHDFRDRLKLDRLDGDDEVGWNVDGKLELTITTGTWEERQVPVFIFTYARLPFPLPGHYC